MNEKMCNIIEEYHMSKFAPASTLVELKLDYNGDVVHFGAIKIGDEIFLFDGFHYSHNGWIYIDTKNSKQKTFIGKSVEFIEKDDNRIKEAIRIYSYIHYKIR